MNILVVGNVIKDVYLNLDSRTEHFETDKHGTKWLDLAFNASEHHFFNRNSSLGGAAVTLEVLQKLTLDATISDSSLDFNHEDDEITSTASTYRYILIADEKATYLAPSKFTHTTFTPPSTPVEYLYLDRSAELTATTAKKITDFLQNSPSTKLITYVRNFNNRHLNQLLPLSELIFSEVANAPELQNLNPAKIIHLSEDRLEYANITEHISAHRIDVLTHLSLYSIASATILGSFILGYSVEDSLKFAHLNLENSGLDSTLTLSELQNIVTSHAQQNSLELIAKNLVLYPKGILAADESGGSIHKKFDQLCIEDTYDNRRDYRNIFFTTPDLDQYVNGIILFDETARQQADNGQNFVDYLTGKRIIPGIKVDQGLEKFKDSEETYTKGLTNLDKRLAEYYQMGLRFAKWRSAFEIRTDDRGNIVNPSDYAIRENCQILAEYAKACQTAGLVPIVEPELVYDGNYNIDQSAETTAKILDALFAELSSQGINLKACLLKVNMILAGKQQEHQSTPAEVGAKTAEVLKAHVPEELAGVVFLSGGQTPEQATDNLAEITKNGPYPWPVTFSFARALQDPALFAWKGNNDNAETAKDAFLERLKQNQKALEETEDSNR